jgi:CarD family transcriptional regulator
VFHKKDKVNIEIGECKRIMYKIGKLLIYGSYGVCRVESIGVPDLSGIDKSKLYYTLCPLYHTEKIFTPIDTSVFMRPVITYDEAQRLISIIPSMRENITDIGNIKLLEVYYRESLKTHDCCDLLRLIKTIYTRARIVEEQGKKLGQIDKRFMNIAEDLLYGEFAIALNMTKESVKTYIEDKVKEQENLYAINI